jgi:transcriptional regulator with XRE-family HTH domain
MNKTTKARVYNSSKLQELLDEVTPVEMEQTKIKMQLAARIEDFVRAKGWSNSQFAEKVGKNPSEITKWFSGTHNFTIDVLTEIAFALGIGLTELFRKNQTQVIDRRAIVVKSLVTSTTITVATPISQGRDFFGYSYLVSKQNYLHNPKNYQA